MGHGFALLDVGEQKIWNLKLSEGTANLFEPVIDTCRARPGVDRWGRVFVECEVHVAGRFFMPVDIPHVLKYTVMLGLRRSKVIN